MKKYAENHLNHIASNHNNSIRVQEVYNELKQITIDLQTIIN